MSNKPNKSQSSKTKITKISAKPAATDDKNDKANNHKTDNKTSSVPKPATKSPTTQPAPVKPAEKAAKVNKTKVAKAEKVEKPLRKVFILARPFVAFGRYLRDSWHEIRQVRWPNRKATWKMTLAVLIYCAIFIIFIVLLDTFFTFIFNLLLN